MKLSIAMMVKNEEKYLDKCLKALRPLMDGVESELIIVDTGSTDDTVEIAKKYTDKVYFYKWNDNFSEVRNVTVKYSTGDWFLYIDADEVMEDAGDIIRFLDSNLSDKYNSASVVIKSITRENDFSIFSAIRLMKNYEGFHFNGAVHNKPVYKLPINNLNTVLLHFGYVATDKELMDKKFERTSSILINELKKDPENIYYWYQLSVSYSMHDDYAKAIEPAEKAYNLLNKKSSSKKDYIYLYSHLALMYFNNSLYYFTEKICIEAISIKKDFIDLYYWMASAQLIMGKNEEALDSYEKYLKVLEYDKENIGKTSYESCYTLGREDEAYKNIIIDLYRLKKYTKAIEYAFKLKNKGMIAEILKCIIKCFIENKDFSGLNDYMKEKSADNEGIRKSFLKFIDEETKSLNDEEKKNLFLALSKEDDNYSLINKIRLNILNKDYSINDDLLDEICSLNFEGMYDIYGDIFYYLLKIKHDISPIIEKTGQNWIEMFFGYISGKYEDISETIYEYLGCNYGKGLKSQLNNIMLRRTILNLDKIDDDKYKEVFLKFIEDGTRYIAYVYSQEVIEKEMSFILNSEGQFFLYMLKGNKSMEENKEVYIAYLKKALEVYPPMKKGMEMLFKDFRKKMDPAYVSDEFQAYKVHVKSTIKNLIDSGHLEDAKLLINEYEDIVKDDIEVVLFKSQIAVKKL